MATWSELIADIYALTTRPDLVRETEIALKNAVRTAHRSGKYWRDLVTTTITAAPDEVQSFDIPTIAPRFRAVGLLTAKDNKLIKFEGLTIDDLLDHDGYYRTNVYWGVGSRLNLRASAPSQYYELSYFQYPLVGSSLFNSWIAEEHPELLSTLAASTVLSIVGEQEIKSRMDQIAAIELQALRNSNIEIEGR